jgi:hypothetical protein
MHEDTTIGLEHEVGIRTANINTNPRHKVPRVGQRLSAKIVSILGAAQSPNEEPETVRADFMPSLDAKRAGSSKSYMRWVPQRPLDRRRLGRRPIGQPKQYRLKARIG